MPLREEESSGLGQRGYFHVLERAHEGSRPSSPGPRTTTPTSAAEDASLDGVPAKGYYERYFKEERRLGMGAEGSVYLATHIISGNVLGKELLAMRFNLMEGNTKGTYAVKKIAVGTSKAYLVRMLREVRLLEALRHPNIIPYHHSWIDLTRFSTWVFSLSPLLTDLDSFGPPITALHVLMMYANAGNLDTFLLARSHSAQPGSSHLDPADNIDGQTLGQLPKEERIKAFKTRRLSARVMGSKREEMRAVLLLGLEEVLQLFGDVVEGLAFLVRSNNVLLSYSLRVSMQTQSCTLT